MRKIFRYIEQFRCRSPAWQTDRWTGTDRITM